MFSKYVTYALELTKRVGNDPKNSFVTWLKLPILKTSTLFENDIWQIFSIYKTKNIDEINVNYDKLVDYLKPMVEKSIYDFNVNIDNTVKIITFITKNNNEYIVIHAKMIKQQKR